jgi:hypothetical protein
MAQRGQFASPEDIDEGQETPPSKRILIQLDRYQKVIHGTAAAKAIGMQAMRRECSHFRQWIERLKALGSQPLAGR